jgi:putative membrane protein
MMHWGNYGWGMGFGWPFIVIFWALFILGIAYIIKVITGKKETLGETALDILKKRYAKGEITKRSLKRRKRILNKFNEDFHNFFKIL